jgi:hypothetical protein
MECPPAVGSPHWALNAISLISQNFELFFGAHMLVAPTDHYDTKINRK